MLYSNHKRNAMTKHFISLFLLTLIFGSCVPAPASLTPLPTVTIAPSQTPRPTQTTIATATPYPLLQTEGPYLLFTYDNKNFTIMDADGSGRKQFQLPNDGYVRDLNLAVSPDGKWLAYFTGSTDEPYDLALNLLNIENQTSVPIANLLAPDYPENLMLTTLNKDLCPTDIPDCQKGSIEADFRIGIYALDWSPDSETLAFAAQIDDPSSDVHLLSIKDGTIRRLVNDLENVWSIDWSPSGKKILYNNFQSGNYTSRELHIADPNILAVQSPKLIQHGPFWSTEGWIDDNSYLIWDGGEGAPPHNFRYINIKSQQLKVFWKYESDGFSFLGDLGGIVVAIYPNQPDATLDSIESGTYFVSMSGERTKLSDDIFFHFDRQSLEDSFFFSDLGRLYTMKLDGSTSPPMSKNISPANISVSPSKEWFVLNKNNSEIELYSKDLQFIQSWDIQTYETIWRPDSVGFFLESYPNLYYISMKDKELELVDVCPSKDCPIRHYVWLP